MTKNLQKRTATNCVYDDIIHFISSPSTLTLRESKNMNINEDDNGDSDEEQ